VGTIVINRVKTALVWGPHLPFHFLGIGVIVTGTRLWLIV